MNTKNKFLENKKILSTLVFAVACALFFSGSKVETNALASDIPLSTGAIKTIEVEVAKVTSAREKYFSAIGKGNGGAYDTYQEAVDCSAILGIRLTTLKNLRNDLQRLSGEIVMRERENQTELPRGTIERELSMIEKEVRSTLVLNKLETIELELQKIDDAATPLESDSAKNVLAGTEKIRSSLEDITQVSKVADELDVIEAELPYLSATASEIIKVSVDRIRNIIEISDESTIIRQIAQNISRLAEDSEDIDLIEADLQKIETKIPALPQNQKSAVQESVDSIRKLLSRKSLAEIRAEEIASLKSEIETITEEIVSPAELEKIEAEEQTIRIAFQESTAKIENCMQAKQDLEKCEIELRDWVAKKEDYQKFILGLENTMAEKTIELEAKLEPLQRELAELEAEQEEQNFTPNLSALSQEINTANLEADILGDIAGGAAKVGSGVGSVVAAPIAAIGGFLGGASSALQSGINAVASATGISVGGVTGLTPSAVVFDGPGAITGLQVFKQNYRGNTYGSAIGTITGWTNFALPFVSVIAIAALVYAGFLYITAAGNEEQTKKAKNIVMWVVIGIILIFSAFAIVNSLLSANSSSSGGGTSIGIDIGGIGINYNN